MWAGDDASEQRRITYRELHREVCRQAILDGDFWITGRVDDVINVSGHRMGTAEVESALASHPKVAEAGVVGMPHDIKGQGIYAFITLNVGETAGSELHADLFKWVRNEIGPTATPDAIQFARALPKTRSGKIMRRILRKIAEQDCRRGHEQSRRHLDARRPGGSSPASSTTGSARRSNRARDWPPLEPDWPISRISPSSKVDNFDLAQTPRFAPLCGSSDEC